MKNYVITGSIGHISRPVVAELVKAGKHVTVISTSEDRVKEIEKLGAKALVGNVSDAQFVLKAFRGADVVYTMIPPIWATSDWRKSQNEVGENYARSIRENNVRYVVNLSSVGADVGHGVGPVDGLFDLEKKLDAIPSLNVKHLRPGFFYYNFLAQIPLVKTAGIMGANYGDGEKIYLVHTKDIAAAAVEELLNLSFTGSSVRYIVSDERSGKDIASVLGKSVGKELPWVIFTDEQQREGLLGAGLSAVHANGYTDMGKALREGVMLKDARRQKPKFSQTKLEDFAKEFAAAYNS